MKKYRIKVNGKTYEVEVESIEQNETKEVKTETKNEVKHLSNDVKTINSPIGGKVLDVKVNVGQTVKVGDVVCIIEAMKLENEVKASVEGTVKEIRVSKGNQVANKEVLIVLG